MQPQQYSKERGLLGKLCPGEKKLVGKTFYLDNVKKRSTALLLEAICLLGGRVESFLHKDVSFVVTGSQECLKEGTTEGTQHPIKQQESVLCNDKQRPGTPRPTAACGSRGKALLETAIRNNERLQRSSVLSNARSWGVKIVYVHDVLLYLKSLTRESFSARHKRPEKSHTKQGCPVVKAAALRSPYLKIEDSSKKYKPLQMQSMTFPALCYAGRFSPFESLPPQFEKPTEQGENKTRGKKVESSNQDKSQSRLSCNPSPWWPRKKEQSYCECCRQPIANLEEHLQSDQHRTFVMDPSNYSEVDQLVAEMLPGFNLNQSEQSEETLNSPPTPLPIHDVCELEPLTDVETEHAVQALQRQGSSFSTHNSSPHRGLPSFGPVSPSPRVPLTNSNPTILPADIQSFSPDSDCHFSDIQPHASSPTMPVLTIEPQPQDALKQQSETQHLSSCPSAPCPLSDPYSLPPVLSPQVLYSSHIVDPQSPYSDPPVLSPQQYSAEETMEGQMYELNTAESASAITLPLSTLLISAAVANAEGVKGSNQEGLVGFSGLIRSSRSSPCAPLSSRRSHSLPRQSATVTNPKKRCRSASPEHSRSKRRRTETCGYSGSCTGQSLKSAKPLCYNMAQCGGCLSFDKASYQGVESCPNTKVSSTLSTCTVDMLDSKQTYTTFCFPSAQNSTQAPNHIDSVAEQPLCLLSSKSGIFDPPLDFPNDKPHSVFSSQDSPCSLPHSTSVCIESALIPDLATLSPSSSDSDWDCDLLSSLGPTAPVTPTEQNCELYKELLHRPCPWMHDTSYESHLHTVLQPSTPAASLCGEEMDPSAFSRTVVQIVEVQH